MGVIQSHKGCFAGFRIDRAHQNFYRGIAARAVLPTSPKTCNIEILAADKFLVNRPPAPDERAVFRRKFAALDAPFIMRSNAFRFLRSPPSPYGIFLPRWGGADPGADEKGRGTRAAGRGHYGS